MTAYVRTGRQRRGSGLRLPGRARVRAGYGPAAEGDAFTARLKQLNPTNDFRHGA